MACYLKVAPVAGVCKLIKGWGREEEEEEEDGGRSQS
jgi:hypothetical protein